MNLFTVIPSGNIGSYYLCRGNVIVTLKQRTLDGHDTGTLIAPSFDPFDDIDLAEDRDEGTFCLHIGTTLTPDGSIVFRRSTQTYVILHNEPFTDEIFKDICSRFALASDTAQHEGIEGPPWEPAFLI